MSGRDVGLFAFARGISNFGGNGAHVALLVVLAAEGGSYVGFYMGAVAFVSVTFAPLNGYLADKASAKHVLVTSDLLCAGCFLAAALSQGATIWIITFGVLSALFEGSSNTAGIAAIGRQDDERVSQVLGTIESARNVGNVIGPAASAVLVSSFGASFAFAANSLTFLVSACAISLIHGFPAAESGNHQSRFGGFAEVLGNTALRRLVVAWIIVAAVASLLVVSDPFRAEEISSTEDFSGLLGVVLSARALGALSGSALVASRSSARGGVLTVVGIAIMCAALAGMGMLENSVTIVMCSFMFGFGDSSAFVGRVTLTSRLVDRSVLGKAQAGFDACIGVVLTIAPPAAALMVSDLGPAGAQIISSAMLLSAALLVLFGVLRHASRKTSALRSSTP
ncbi:MFS transporter [Actinomyces bowdenii]|uniref:MFS transporter n=1 Tax=Actinomyces bowdenii TaxID=131109 RepID=UPI001ABC05FE|nr:MFS transporter [Actinomyces bowdenii]MBO3725288.1 MFS transporter [Actinomyces bowdenii]